MAKKAAKSKKASSKKSTAKKKQPVKSRKTAAKKSPTKKAAARKKTTGKKSATRKAAKKKSRKAKTIEYSAEEKQRAKKVIRQLKKDFPVAECALIHSSAYELLVATILSAQCTDERVNASTPALFKKYPTVADLANSKQKDVEKIVNPLGFFRAKATNIRGMAAAVVENHNSEIPDTMEELIALPGVGRKTASVLLGTWFGTAVGVVVDTHVKRISGLLGFTTSNNPEIAERQLMALLPQKEWIMYSHRIIHHGRKVCIARRPKCTTCSLLALCERTDLPELAEEEE